MRMAMLAMLIFLTTFAYAQEAKPIAPATNAHALTKDYQILSLRGWNVLAISRLVEEHPKLWKQVQELLGAQLFQIERMVPPDAVDKIRQIPIWIEINDERFPGMCYHPSRDWLAANGYNPEKAGSVQIGNATNFLSWSNDQPWMALHEMAHAFHHKIIGHDNREIQAAYQNAKQSGIYDSVLRCNGKKERAYALNNEQEYFAELSEAYFGVNDFYPFVRAELRIHDPAGYEMAEMLWNDAAKESKPRD